MYKIGFIDYFLDEWHAENYPRWIEQFSRGRFVLHGAFGDIEPPYEGRRSNAEFCKDHKIVHYESIEALVADCDALILLAPDHPEEHVRLAEEAIITNKPIFIDKTFADSEVEAHQIFKIAAEHEAPIYTTSALRYASAYDTWPDMKDGAVVLSFGSGNPEQYLIHQLEPLIAKMQERPQKVLSFLGTDEPSDAHVFLLEFTNDVKATLVQRSDLPFQVSVHVHGDSHLMTAEDAFFEKQVEAMLDFFEVSIKAHEQNSPTPLPPVTRDETIEIMGTRDLLLRALEQPGEWVNSDASDNPQ